MVITPEQLPVLARLCIGRQDDYAVQGVDGRYTRAFHSLSWDVLRLHLAGGQTIGSYVIDERGLCRFAVFDADSDETVLALLDVQAALAREGVASYLEGSRRGGHLWVFLAAAIAPDLLRRWLLPSCPRGVEFYPKQDRVSNRHPGSLVRVPLGVHRLAGRRYPFVTLSEGKLVPVARSVGETLTWLSSVKRVPVPEAVPRGEARTRPASLITKNTLQKSVNTRTGEQSRTIRDWCLQQDARTVIGRYVALDSSGMGRCPFDWHQS